MLETLFAKGQVIWLILVVVVIEAVVLAAWLSRSQRARLVPGLLSNLAAGFCLMAAIGVLLADGGLALLALLLAASLVAHVADLWLRLRA
jgi:hypothetical protein